VGEPIPYRAPGSAWGVAAGDKVTVFLNGGARLSGVVVEVSGSYLDISCFDGLTRVAVNQIAAVRGVAPR